MIQSIQKIIKVGSSDAVTLPAKEMRRQNLKTGDEVEVIVRPVAPKNVEDQAVIKAAKRILQRYKEDFEHLAKR